MASEGKREGEHGDRGEATRHSKGEFTKEEIQRRISRKEHLPDPSTDQEHNQLLHSAIAVSDDITESLPKRNQPVASALRNKHALHHSLMQALRPHMENPPLHAHVGTNHSLILGALAVHAHCLSHHEQQKQHNPLCTRAVHDAGEQVFGMCADEDRRNLNKLNAHDLFFSRLVNTLHSGAFFDAITKHANGASANDVADAIDLLQHLYDDLNMHLIDALSIPRNMVDPAVSWLHGTKALSSWEAFAERAAGLAHHAAAGALAGNSKEVLLHYHATAGLLDRYDTALQFRPGNTLEHQWILDRYKEYTSIHTNALLQELRTISQPENCGMSFDMLEEIAQKHGAHQVIYEMHSDDVDALLQRMHMRRLGERKYREDSGFAVYALQRLSSSDKEPMLSALLRAAPEHAEVNNLFRTIANFLETQKKWNLLWAHHVRHIQLTDTSMADVSELAFTHARECEKAGTEKDRARSAAIAKLAGAAYAKQFNDTRYMASADTLLHSEEAYASST